MARADASSDFSESAFADVVTEYLIDSGTIPEFTSCLFKHRGVRIDGYAFVDEEATLDLFVVDYRGGASPESLTRTEMAQVFRRAETFFEKALSSRFAEDIEVSSPAYGLIQQIREEANSIRRVRFFLLSDAILSSAVKDIPSRMEEGREWVYRVWDLSAIAKVMATGEPEDIIVNFDEMFGEPLACLPATSETENLKSYLAVVPGQWLASIYDKYSGRLLEQNVRTFLQVRGGVNKAIRRTILDDPGMFFSYNNGISATAEEADVTRKDGTVQVHSLRNFQIVNGGQTTASIYNAMKKDRATTIDQIYVQMKLSVVSADVIHDLVPKISRFANSQNRITDADFFSNHPFHIRIEGLSRRIWAPPLPGSQIQTHWFYERARGQYANQQAYLTAAKKREFQLQNPRQQLINKTDLAKYCNTFRCLPHEVSLGAQKNFGRFAEFISDSWSKNETNFNDLWFQTAVSQAIVFRTIEKMVQEADWYAQGYRANTVTYSIALLAARIRTQAYEFNYGRIWQRQTISEAFRAQLLLVAKLIQKRIVEAAVLYGISNVTEWCKRKACWDDIQQNVTFELNAAFLEELETEETSNSERKSGRREQKRMNEAEATVAVVERGSEFWKRMLVWGESGTELSPSDIRTLKVGASIPRMIPTGPQSMKLLEICERAERAGFKQARS